MVSYSLSRRGDTVPAADSSTGPTAPFLGRAAHSSVAAAAVAAVRGASGAEAAVLRVAAFRQRPSLSPTLLLPAAVEEAPVAGGAAMAGPPDAAVTAVYAVPNRAELDMAEGGGGLTADKAKAKAEADRITVLVHAIGGATPVNVIATPDVTLQDLLDEYVRETSPANASALNLFYRGRILPLDRTVGDYNLREGSKVYVVTNAPGTS